ncbi:MAG: hypothetical protein PHF60_05600 [Candidatus ainarchaeum sp.]|nr:hypothetical protein [Candidatus ainarchaeum sp.]
MAFRVPGRHSYHSVMGKGAFRAEPLVSAGISRRIAEDIVTYHWNMEALADSSRVDLDCIPGKTHFKRAIDVFRQAAEAYAEGPEAFRRFKFSQDFREELVGFMGAEKGVRLFDAWSSDSSAEAAGMSLRETGAFEDSFYGGKVNGKPNCQEPTLRTFHIGGITGTIELPWIKQVVVGDIETGFDYRRRLFLMKGHDGLPVLLIQPAYHRAELPHVDELNAKASILISRYEPLGVDVRLMPPAMLSRDEGVNTGYSTFASGRSPLFYIDSNCHVWSIGENDIARNGLHAREEGESIHFGRGWRSEHRLV